MNIYIALLRGINVGGKNMIKMVNLKRTFESLGFSRVQTYIQSGNVLFESDEKEDILQKKIEQQIEVDYGFSVSVILRTATELEQLLQGCPFSAKEIATAESSAVGESLYVSLLASAPDKEEFDALSKTSSEGDKCYLVNRDIYLLFSYSVRNSKLATNLGKLDIPATTRNWKTLTKLHELAKDMV